MAFWVAGRGIWRKGESATHAAKIALDPRPNPDILWHRFLVLELWGSQATRTRTTGTACARWLAADHPVAWLPGCK
jgi:hypothetical protein